MLFAGVSSLVEHGVALQAVWARTGSIVRAHSGFAYEIWMLSVGLSGLVEHGVALQAVRARVGAVVRAHSRRHQGHYGRPPPPRGGQHPQQQHRPRASG